MDKIIAVKNLTKYYSDKKPAVYDVSFSVGKGEVFALLGPNGTGKTTIMQMLMGFLEPSRGSSSILGCDSQKLTPEIRGQIGYLAEGHHIYNWMKINEIASFTSSTHPMWDSNIFNNYMDYFNFDLNEKIKNLSNGQRASVSLALTMSCKPKVLVMDDPTLGLDAGVRRDFLKGMIELVSENECSILFSSHIMSDVERISDRIGIIIDGVLRADLSLDDFRSNVVSYEVEFKNGVPENIDIPNVINKTVVENLNYLTVVKPSENVEVRLRELGAHEIKQSPISLEDAYIDFTSIRNC